HMGMARSAITILNRHSGELIINESFGLTPEEQARGRYKLGEGIIGQVVETGKPIVVPRIAEEPRFLDRTKSRGKIDKTDFCFICVPIRAGSEVIGTLSADRKSEPKFDRPNSSNLKPLAPQVLKNDMEWGEFEQDVNLLTIIATMISQAVRLRQLAHEENHPRRINSSPTGQTETSPSAEAFYIDSGDLDADRPANIIGNSKPMRSVFKMIDKISKTNATVLILGESGVGKELVANAIHYKSRRASRPFIKFNCAALPESIIESELFGHERGAFTGAAAARKGRFELADGGTVFLDEVGELSLQIQAKLLRILQEREFERVGGSKTLKVDVRVIAATNRNLEESIQQGQFREDLYYRLNIFPITMPPLRERKADILLLADYFVEKYNQINAKGVRRISTAAIDMLMRYHWPGNVRELENSIERAVILSEDGVIHGYHLPPTLQTAESSGTPYKGPLQQRLDAIEYEMIVEALKSTKGNMSKAAAELGLTDRIMGLRVKRFGIDFRNFRSQH
ncbi:MAG: sigma 54-interacting transcriptional regulator, partial [Chlorobiales bacterium]|nr:sigma 54-interacting transcriptional regulator [Chlorobiales bacterium]